MSIKSGTDQTGAGGQPESGPRRAGYGRRAVMLGAATAGAGSVASLVGGSGVAQASGTPVELGESNAATATTGISTKGGDGLAGSTTAGGQSGLSGTDTSSDGGYGVYGTSDNGKGVFGVTGDSGSAGVYGQTSSTGHAGVHGTDLSGGAGGYGVYGISDNGYGVYGVTNAAGGVAMVGIAAEGSIGVWGQIGTGPTSSLPEFLASGVAGLDTTSAGNTGISGVSDKGTGVFAASNSNWALQVNGTAKFSNSGIAKVPLGSTTVKVTTACTTSSIVLATLQQVQHGVYVAAAVATAGSFTITLNKAATAELSVGWFVID